jgi:hypothetical protein
VLNFLRTVHWRHLLDATLHWGEWSVHGLTALYHGDRAPLYLLDMRQVGPQDSSGRCGEEKSTTAGNITCDAEPVVRCHTDWGSPTAYAPYNQPKCSICSSGSVFLLLMFHHVHLVQRRRNVLPVRTWAPEYFVFFDYFGFPCLSSFHRFLHNHHHLSSGAGTIGQ